MPAVGEENPGEGNPIARMEEEEARLAMGMELEAAAANELRLERELETHLKDMLSNDPRPVKQGLRGIKNHTSFLALHPDLVRHSGVVTLVTCLNRYCWQMDVCEIALERLHELTCAPRSKVIQHELVRTGSLSAVKAACGTYLIRRHSGVMVWAFRVLRGALLSREGSLRLEAHEIGRVVIKSFQESTGVPEWTPEARREANLLDAALLRHEVGESDELDQVEGEMKAPDEQTGVVNVQPVFFGVPPYRPRLKGDLQEPSKSLKKQTKAKAREEARLAEIGLAEKEAIENARGFKTWID